MKVQMFEGDFDNNNIEKLEKNLRSFMTKNEPTKKSDCKLQFRILNGYFMNQYAPVTPNQASKHPLYKNIAPEGMTFQDALEDINSTLSNNYNLQVS